MAEANVFIDAQTAREETLEFGNVVVLEINAVQNQIRDAIDSGNLEVLVTSGTTMTDSNTYYDVYYGVTEDPPTLKKILTVQEYFLDKGYGFRIVESSDGNNVNWQINW